MIRDDLLLDNRFASATHAAVTCSELVQERFLYLLRYGSLRRSGESWLSENTATTHVHMGASCSALQEMLVHAAASAAFCSFLLVQQGDADALVPETCRCTRRRTFSSISAIQGHHIPLTNCTNC